jgi:hypothetical protein
MQQALLEPDIPLDMSRPHLWKLQRAFADEFLRWLPLIDHETASMHLNSAQIAKHSSSTNSTCLVLLMYAIGSIAADSSVYTNSPRDLPGFSCFTRACALFRHHPSPSKDLVTLQSRILVAVYLLFAMRPLEAWKSISQTSQDCMVLLKTNFDRLTSEYRASFGRIYWICYVLENELEVCLEVPPSGIRSYETLVPLPTSHYDEEGLYYLLALSSLRKLMMEVVDTVGLNSPSATVYAPVVALELRSQIDDWHHHLPSSLRFPLDQSFLFDTRKAYLRCAYHALIAVVTWPFVLRCKNVLYEVESRNSDEEAERIAKSANDCLKACRDYLEAGEEILTQRSLVSHLVVRA